MKMDPGIRILDKTEYEQVIKVETKPESGKLKMGEVVRLVSELTNGDVVIVTDVGRIRCQPHDTINFVQQPGYFGGMGTMGFGLPA
jgi:acetolactate synthase-1/2/3 large subunit